jgi:hypothetical protein
MNNTKWDELRVAMHNLGSLRPLWRSKDLSGYVSSWDGDWFYHFRDGSYSSIEWLEIQVLSPEQDYAVFGCLQEIHVPGHRIQGGFRVFGYASDGAVLNYI